MYIYIHTLYILHDTYIFICIYTYILHIIDFILILLGSRCQEWTARMCPTSGEDNTAKGHAKAAFGAPKNRSSKAPRKVTEFMTPVYSRSQVYGICWAFSDGLLMLSLRPLLCIPSRHPLLFTWVVALSYAWLHACECVIWHAESWESWEHFCSV